MHHKSFIDLIFSLSFLLLSFIIDIRVLIKAKVIEWFLYLQYNFKFYESSFIDTIIDSVELA